MCTWGTGTWGTEPVLGGHSFVDGDQHHMSITMSETTEHSSPPTNMVWRRGEHLPMLDGLRGLAIALVTCYRFAKDFPQDTLIGMFLGKLFGCGDRGVDLFFVLSGFLITGILVDARDKQHYFRNFFVRRSLRIFPLYFVALTIFLSLGYRLDPESFRAAIDNQFYLWTYTTNLKMSWEGVWCFGRLDHFWSLAVEEHFYLVWPFVVYYGSPRRVLRLTLLAAFLCALARILFASSSDNGVAPDVATFFRCDALLIGAFLALQAREAGGLLALRRFAPAILIACIAVGLTAAVADRRMLTISHSLWPLLWGSLLLWTLSGSERSPLARLLSLPVLRSLGKYSYAMYIFQNPLIPFTAGLWTAASFSNQIGIGWLGHVAYVACMFGLTYAIAVVSWYVLESHFLKLKRYF